MFQLDAEKLIQHEESLFMFNCERLRSPLRKLAAFAIKVLGDPDLMHRHERRQCACWRERVTDAPVLGSSEVALVAGRIKYRSIVPSGEKCTWQLAADAVDEGWPQVPA